MPMGSNGAHVCPAHVLFVVFAEGRLRQAARSITHGANGVHDHFWRSDGTTNTMTHRALLFGAQNPSAAATTHIRGDSVAFQNKSRVVNVMAAVAAMMCDSSTLSSPPRITDTYRVALHCISPKGAA